MESKNMIASVIALVITVLLVSTLLIPTISYSATEYAIYKNTGTYFSAVSDDDVVHTIVISTGQGSFVITTDDRTDITPSMGTYNPGGVYMAPAIAIGVYESYSDDGVLRSISGVTPTSSQTIDVNRTQALANNSDVTTGTYQLWNYYDYTLYKIIATTVMGNMDSQYMMGPGQTPGETVTPNTTGTANGAYVVSATNADSVSLLLENTWGSLMEMVGDTSVKSRTFNVGNTLGGHTISNVVNTLGTTVMIPDLISNLFITSITNNPAIWGTPMTASGGSTGTPGEAINDGLFTGGTSNNIVTVGGPFAYGGGQDGLYYFKSNDGFTGTGDRFGARLCYVMTNYTPTTTNYGYIMEYSDTGTVTTVTLADGTTEIMPTGTTLNSHWDFDENGIGPFGCYYVAINLETGDNDDDAIEERLSKVKGEVAYIINPSDWSKTLAGSTFTETYNIMLVIPTTYWGVVDEKLYMSNDPSTFSDVEGLEMHAYAHTYTVDPTVDTGNPNTTSSASIVFGEDAIVRLYETGDVMIIGTNGATRIGQVVGDTTVTLTVTGNTLSYTGGTMSKVLAYISSDGEYVYAKNPMVTDNSTIIIGGYAHDLETTEDDVVDIGYCASSKVSEFATTTVTELNPVSTSSYTVDETTTTVNTSSVTTNLKRIDSILFETSWEDSGTDKGSSTATYTYFLAPASVTYNNPDYVGDQYSTILTVIPVLVILGILITVAGLVAYSRR